MRKKVKILSIDGGGLRGIVPVLILKRIEEISNPNTRIIIASFMIKKPLKPVLS